MRSEDSDRLLGLGRNDWNDGELGRRRWRIVDMRLEVVVVPVSDVDRAKAFYEKAGFNVDVDSRPNEDLRVVQMTPPGSACSISMVKGPGAPDMEPGSLQGLQITTSDLPSVRAELAERGVEISEIQRYDQQVRGFRPVDGDLEVFNAFAFFNDPDGNGWVIQQGPAPD
jgi:catechol 2,3-dioxygenase-like lactoylglutathione lyase family enzyme